MTANTRIDFEGREFRRIVEERLRAGRPFVNPDTLLDILLQHSAPDHPLADRTPVSDPDHWVVGREFGGHDLQHPTWKGSRWFCASHDSSGYWMYNTDGSGHWSNVSERAIGRAFHEIHREPDGRLHCSWFHGKVPSYVDFAAEAAALRTLERVAERSESA